jgi:hypothetical protein
LSSDDIGLLTELPVGEDNVGEEEVEDDCWAYAWILLQIPKSITPTRNGNSAKIVLAWLILIYINAILLFMWTNQ